jgi:hypothetical protein
MPDKSRSKTPDFWNLRAEAGSRAVRRGPTELIPDTLDRADA